MSRPLGMRGFSLIELLAAIVLMGIALAIAVPNFAFLIRKSQIEAQAQTLNSLLQFARSEAVVRRTPITVSRVGDVWTVSTATQPLRRETFNSEQAAIKSNPDPLALTYTSSGTSSLAATASITICRDNDLTTAFVLTVDRSGSSRLHTRGLKSDNKTVLASCNP